MVSGKAARRARKKERKAASAATEALSNLHRVGTGTLYPAEVVAEALAEGIPLVRCDGCGAIQPCPHYSMLPDDDDGMVAPCVRCGCETATYVEAA